MGREVLLDGLVPDREQVGFGVDVSQRNQTQPAHL